MKKGGFINGLVKAGILAATIGGTIYLLKDKIEECPKCKESLDKAKDAWKKFKDDDTGMDYSEDFEEDFEDVDDLDEILETPIDREYVSIKLSEENNHEADEDGVLASMTDSEPKGTEDASEKEEVPDLASLEETVPEEYMES